MAAEKRMWVSMILSVLVGLAYIAWLAWTEGWRMWVVMGALMLVAGLGGLVHTLMGMARRRDGLEEDESDSIETEDRAQEEE